MGLDKLVADHGPVEPELWRIACTVWPDAYRGTKAPKYRKHVLDEWLTREGTPQKRNNGQRFRTKNESRLDRTWTEVAKKMDRTPEDIRDCTLRMYDGDSGAYANVTAHFLADLVEIEEKWEQHKTNST